MFGRTSPMARSSAAICWTSRLTAREGLERGDKRFEVGEGDDGNVLLIFDDALLSGDGVQRLGEFETTRCMRHSGFGFVVRGSLVRVLKQGTRGTLEIVGDAIDHGVEPGRTFPCKDL